MPNWKKLIVSGSDASLNTLQLTGLTTSTDNTTLVVDSSGNVKTKEITVSNGSSGTSGVNGTPGTPGTPGSNGSSGTSGNTGSSGTSGVNGTPGTPGSNGSSGTSGINGVDGILPLSGTTTNGVITFDGDGTGTVESNFKYTNDQLTVGSNSNNSSQSTIAGGYQNTLSNSSLSIIGGGFQNCISGTMSYNSLLGGQGNKIIGSANSGHSIGGGLSNQINTSGTSCNSNTVSGGCSNSIMSADRATIGGGTNHYLSGKGATIAGGVASLAWGDCSFIGGGYDNRTLCNYSTVVGGKSNHAYGFHSSILGGQSNRICGAVGTISGGDQNYNTGCLNFIGGGFQNKIGCHTATEGYSNCSSVIVGGACNFIDGTGTSVNSCQGNFIGGGTGNCIRFSRLSSILGGYNNNVYHDCSHIIGNSLQSTADNYTFMNNVCVAGTTRTTSLVETSARKHKECITPLQDQIENIKKLEPVNFQWKEGKNQDIGFIAEEVKAVYPNLVSYEEDGEIHGVHYSKLTTVLVKALQQQQTQIDELRMELNILKNK